MIKKLLPIPVLAAALWCSAAYAQEASQDSQAQDQTPQTETGSDLDLGESGPRVGEQYAKEESGDWTIMCLKTADGNDPCLLRQVLTGQDGQPVADISIEKLPESAPAMAAASVIVPHEVLLQAQLALSIDGAPGKRYNYHHCNPVGCIAQLGFTDGDVAAMKSGSKGTLSMVSVLAPNQLFQLEISLDGFTSGFENLKPIRN